MNNTIAKVAESLAKAIDDNDLDKALTLIDSLRPAVVQVQQVRAKCVSDKHPGARAVSSPSEGTTEMWCSTCELYWLEHNT